MRARDTSNHRHAEARHRSGHKQSRTERKLRRERRATQASNVHPFGIRLQEAVCDRLTRLGIVHERYANNHPVARAERVELALETPLRRIRRIKVQYTLRHRTRPKIFQFLTAALSAQDAEVPRVYLEINAPQGMQAKDLAHRVVYALQKIVQGIRELPREIGNVIGLTLDAAHKSWREHLAPLSLLNMLSDGARSAVLSVLHAVQQARTMAAAAKRAQAAAAVPFYRLCAAVHRQVAGLLPHPEPIPVRAVAQRRYPLRMPFRR